MYETPDHHLSKLRHWRNTEPGDQSLHFMQDQFKREVQKPYKQLCQISSVWMELVPPALLAQTRLESLSRSVLRVTVSSSSVLYELDRLLRSGLQDQIITQNKGPAIRKIQLRVGSVE